MQYGNVKKYLKWKNEKDSISRHAFYMKAWKKFIDLQKSHHVAQPAGAGPIRLHCSGEVVGVKTVSSEEQTGLKNVDHPVFKEVWKWKKDNPGKKVPLDRVTTRMVLNDEGKQVEAEGIWEKT